MRGQGDGSAAPAPAPPPTARARKTPCPHLASDPALAASSAGRGTRHSHTRAVLSAGHAGRAALHFFHEHTPRLHISFTILGSARGGGPASSQETQGTRGTPSDSNVGAGARWLCCRGRGQRLGWAGEQAPGPEMGCQGDQLGRQPVRPSRLLLCGCAIWTRTPQPQEETASDTATPGSTVHVA